jgi:hypothetical protein
MADAEIITRKGERFAKWRDKTGKMRTATHAGRDGTQRIIATAGTYTAKYRRGGGLVQKATTGCRDETAARRVLVELERRAELVKANVLTVAENKAADFQGLPLEDHFRVYLNHQKPEPDGYGDRDRRWGLFACN